MKYYVYKLIDPRDKTVFYVGKGQKDRMYHHEKEAIKGIYSRKCKKIREILQSGLCIEYEIDSRYSDESKAYSREKDLIQSIGLENLTNVVAGGGGIIPAREKAETWSDVRSTVFALADVMHKHARGHELYLHGLNLVEMAKSYISRLIANFGIEKVAKEFKKYNVEVRHGCA